MSDCHWQLEGSAAELYERSGAGDYLQVGRGHGCSKGNKMG
jgi:hypothetical protein